MPPTGVPAEIASVSGVLDLSGGALRRRVQAMVAVEKPDRMRLEFTDGASTAAVVGLDGGEAWCALPAERIAAEVSVEEMTADVLGIALSSRELVSLLAGEMPDGWRSLGGALQRGDGAISDKTTNRSGFPIEHRIQAADTKALIRWRQISFNADFDGGVFKAPDGYELTSWDDLMRELGLVKAQR